VNIYISIQRLKILIIKAEIQVMF